VTIKSTLKLKDKFKSSLYIELLANSQIKYECLSGYHLKTTRLRGNHEVVYSKKSTIEKCTEDVASTSNDIDNDLVTNKDAPGWKRKRDKFELLELENSNRQEQQLDDDDPSSTTSSISSNVDLAQIENFHECVKPCKPFKTNKSILNGFLVPSRDLYYPGDEINYLCHEGYLVELPFYENKTTNMTTRISNMHVLECGSKGSWHLADADEPPRTSSDRMVISRLPVCSDIKSFNLDSGLDADNKLDVWSPYNSFSYAELNLRSILLIFTIAGILLVILILSLLTRRFYRTRHNDFFYQNYLTQIDPFLLASENANSNDSCSLRVATSVTGAATTAPFNSNPTAASNLISTAHTPSSVSHLPSYEEAVNQATSVAGAVPTSSNANGALAPELANQIVRSNPSGSNLGTVKTTTESVVPNPPSYTEAAQSSSSDGGHVVVLASRSSSIRSNLTIRSANPSIRTTNSMGNASCNLPVNKRQHSCSSKSSRRHHHHHHHNNHASRHKTPTGSEACASAMTNSDTTCNAEALGFSSTLTAATTNSSLLSDQSNASKVTMRGSTTHATTTSSNDDSLSSAAVEANVANDEANDESERLIDLNQNTNKNNAL
jgi:hypothetical protein